MPPRSPSRARAPSRSLNIQVFRFAYVFNAKPLRSRRRFPHARRSHFAPRCLQRCRPGFLAGVAGRFSCHSQKFYGSPLSDSLLRRFRGLLSPAGECLVFALRFLPPLWPVGSLDGGTERRAAWPYSVLYLPAEVSVFHHVHLSGSRRFFSALRRRRPDQRHAGSLRSRLYYRVFSGCRALLERLAPAGVAQA